MIKEEDAQMDKIRARREKWMSFEIWKDVMVIKECSD